MQIACKRFSCQKAVEVCYWACKYRRDCKDWHGALDETPGTNAITERLSAAAKKSGRVFDPQTMVLTSSGKKKDRKNRAAIISKSPSARFTPASVLATEVVAEAKDQDSHNHPINNPREAKVKMMEDNFCTSTVTETGGFAESAAAPTKSATTKPRPKPVVKPKAADQTGPVYLLLFANGKYKELRESDLNSEAAGVLKDPSLRLIKGQALVPQISFKAIDE